MRQKTWLHVKRVSLVALLVGCSSNTPPASTFTCAARDGSSCVEFLAGWTADESNASCNPISSTWSAERECPAGRIAHCTTSSGGDVAIVNWYGSTSLDADRANCDALGGDFAAP